jgi:uncharacterized membrane protein YdjX (TVP38/TMEM64 family)
MKILKIGMMALIVLLAAWFIYINRDHLTKDEIISYGRSLPATGFIALFAILPLIGFPISILLVLAGLRFGFGWGMAVSVACIYFHHAVAYPICHGGLRERISGFVKNRGHQLPSMKGSSGFWFTLMFTSVHGPPYMFKLYLLALTDISFRLYAGVGGTTYILFALIPVGAAAAATHMNVTYLYVAIAAVSGIALAFNHFRKRRKTIQQTD